MAIPAFRAGRVQTGKSTKMTMEVPTGTSAHDYLLCIVRISGEEKPSTPANWTLIAEGSSGSNNRVYGYELVNWSEGEFGKTFTWELGVEKEFSQEMVAIKEAHHSEPRVGVSAFKQTSLSTTVKCASMTITKECLGVIMSAAVLTTATYEPTEANGWKEDNDSKGLWSAHRSTALTSSLTEQQVATGSSAATNYWVLAVGVQWGAAFETQEGKAQIAGTGAIAPKGFNTTFGKATVAGTGTISAKGALLVSGKATISGSGTVTAKDTIVRLGKATVTGTGSLTAKGTIAKIGKATVSGTGSITAKGLIPGRGAAFIAGTGTISAKGSVGAGNLFILYEGKLHPVTLNTIGGHAAPVTVK